MDFLSALDELESMAAMVEYAKEDKSGEQVTRFQKLFGYSDIEAKCALERHRDSTSRKPISNTHWEMVRAEKEAQGYDREAYEYAMEAVFNSQEHDEPKAVGDPKATYMVKLEGPLDSAQTVKDLANMPELPAVKKGRGAMVDALFCEINGKIRAILTSALSGEAFAPTFIRIIMAAKNLSANSFAPTLGLEDPTLPQHRVDDADHVFLPTQNQFPVWYFVYGNLRDPKFLMNKLELPEAPVLRQARVAGGIVKSWGKYRALVDGPADATVDEWAYLVESEEHEGKLRYHESDQYEVVRCMITMTDNGESVPGLVFKFVGEVD